NEPAEDLRPSRVLAQEEPRQSDGEERLRLDDERGEPDRKALVDRDEEQAELSDAEQQAVQGDLPGRRLRRADEEDRRKRREDEPQRGEHERRGLRHADLDGDEGQAPNDRDADRRQGVSQSHSTNARPAAGWAKLRQPAESENSPPFGQALQQSRRRSRRRRLLQIDGLIMASLVQLRAPHLMRTLVPVQTESHRRAQSQVEIMRSLEFVDEFFRVYVASDPLDSLGENVGVDVTFERNVIR